MTSAPQAPASAIRTAGRPSRCGASPMPPSRMNPASGRSTRPEVACRSTVGQRSEDQTRRRRRPRGSARRSARRRRESSVSANRKSGTRRGSRGSSVARRRRDGGRQDSEPARVLGMGVVRLQRRGAAAPRRARARPSGPRCGWRRSRRSRTRARCRKGPGAGARTRAAGPASSRSPAHQESRGWPREPGRGVAIARSTRRPRRAPSAARTGTLIRPGTPRHIRACARAASTPSPASVAVPERAIRLSRGEESGREREAERQRDDEQQARRRRGRGPSLGLSRRRPTQTHPAWFRKRTSRPSLRGPASNER